MSKLNVIAEIMLRYPDYSAAKLKELVRQTAMIIRSDIPDKEASGIIRRLEEYHRLSAHTEAMAGTTGESKV